MRPGVPDEVVAAACAGIEVPAGGRVLELGSGSGQLTAPLLRAGLSVDVVEPSARMRELLSARCGDGIGAIYTEAFEDLELDHGSYDAVCAANTFHWLDPEIAYAKAAQLVKPAGGLVLTWVHPIAVSATLHDRLAFVTETIGIRGGVPLTRAELPALDERLAAGRAEIADSGCWRVAGWTAVATRMCWKPLDYVAYLATFYPGGTVSEAQCAELADATSAVLAEMDTTDVELELRWYTVLARAI